MKRLNLKLPKRALHESNLSESLLLCGCAQGEEDNAINEIDDDPVFCRVENLGVSFTFFRMLESCLHLLWFTEICNYYSYFTSPKLRYSAMYLLLS